MKYLKIKNKVRNSIARLLVPLFRILLHFNISFTEFNELAKRAYVYTCFKYHKEEGRKTTAISVSKIANISRQEVSRISKLNDDTPLLEQTSTSAISNVLGGWLRNEKYTDQENNPIPLVMKNQFVSFESLVSDYGKEESKEAILSELLKINAVFLDKDDQVILKRKSYVPESNELKKFSIVMQYSARLLSSGLENISNDTSKNFQRGVSFENIPLAVVEDFKKYSSVRSAELLNEYNTWFYKNMKKSKIDGLEKKTQVGVGIFYFDEKNSKE